MRPVLTSFPWKIALLVIACWGACSVPAQGTDASRAITSMRIGPGSSTWVPARIEVFATSAMHIANSERATVHRVDAHEQLAAELDQGGLPPEQQQALAIVRGRIQAMGPSLQSRVQAALQAIRAATLYGVQRLPAVVFDGSRVVYDVADVARAIEIVQRGGGQPIGERFMPGSAENMTPPSSNRRPTP